MVGVLTHDDVRRIAREEGLGRNADALLDSVRPGWRLEVRRGVVAPLGGSRIGGIGSDDVAGENDGGGLRATDRDNGRNEEEPRSRAAAHMPSMVDRRWFFVD